MFIKRAILICVLALTSGLLASCNIGAAAFYIIHGPPRTPAMYTLPDRPTVVFVDDRNNTIKRNADTLRREIAHLASEELMTNKVLTQTIRPADAMAYARQHDRVNEIMSIDDIGRAVGAEQIIYVEMLAFTESPDGYTPRPVAAVNVKVIDVTNRVRLFPPPEAEQGAYMLQVTMPPVSGGLYESRSSRVEIYKMLAAATGDELAKMFYSHETNELGGNLDPR